VFLECWKLGIAWRGLKHDMSKFSRAEWTPYVKRFYGDGGDNEVFQKALDHHYRHNSHHWNFHVLDRGIRVMKVDDIKEMVADWRSMARVRGGSAKKWYSLNKDRMILHKETQKKLKIMFHY
jgi:hypothetical protein